MQPTRTQALAKPSGRWIVRAIPLLIAGFALVSVACGAGVAAPTEDESISSTDATVRSAETDPVATVPESSRPQPDAVVVAPTTERPEAQVADPASSPDPPASAPAASLPAASVPAASVNETATAEAASENRSESEEATVAAVAPATTAAAAPDEDEDTSGSDSDSSATVTVDARDDSAWAFVSFTSGTIAARDFAGSDWDLAFQRTSLRTNSGVTNAGGPGGAVALGEIGFAEASVPSNAEFTVDAFEEDGGEDVSNAAISDWYVYRFADHTISPHPQLFAVRTHGGQIAIVKFESYYCADGSAGCVTLRYELVAP